MLKGRCEEFRKLCWQKLNIVFRRPSPNYWSSKPAFANHMTAEGFGFTVRFRDPLLSCLFLYWLSCDELWLNRWNREPNLIIKEEGWDFYWTLKPLIFGLNFAAPFPHIGIKSCYFCQITHITKTQIQIQYLNNDRTMLRKKSLGQQSIIKSNRDPTVTHLPVL